MELHRNTPTLCMCVWVSGERRGVCLTGALSSQDTPSSRHQTKALLFCFCHNKTILLVHHKQKSILRTYIYTEQQRACGGREREIEGKTWTKTQLSQLYTRSQPHSHTRRMNTTFISHSLSVCVCVCRQKYNRRTLIFPISPSLHFTRLLFVTNSRLTCFLSLHHAVMDNDNKSHSSPVEASCWQS